MKSPYPTRTALSSFVGKVAKASFLGALLLGAGLILPTEAEACDACNISFAREVLQERPDSLASRDLRRAMENQQGLKLDGMGSEGVREYHDELLALAVLTPPQADAEPPTQDSATADREDPQSDFCGACDQPATHEQVSSENDKTPLRLLPAGVPATEGSPQPTVQLASDRFVPNPNPVWTGEDIPDYMANADFPEIVARDFGLAIPPTSYVPQEAPADKSFSIVMNEGKTYIGNGVIYEGFVMDNKIPGPTIIVDQGDVVEMAFVNEGAIPHGASIHAADTQTSKYVGSINPGQTKSVRFRANVPGVYMYHCAPGGHAIGMHVIGGQYGMIVVRPAPGSYELERQLGHEPNLELFLIQHELYDSGKGSIEGSPTYVLCNGRTFRYVEEPIITNPGDYVRIHFLNVGPNLLSTFHIVGIIWDFVYWQGHPENLLKGGQTVTAGPSDSFTIEFRMPPDEGAYTMLSHAVGSTNRGAIGLLVVDGDAELEPHRQILADGPTFTEEEMQENIEGAVRTINPFGIGTGPADQPVVYGPETEEVHISIIGNAYYPKVVQVAPGTKVTWTNEDAFTYLAGEYSGVHNVAGTTIPEDAEHFVSPLLTHGEKFSHVFETEGDFYYMCTPHPYMEAKVIVKESNIATRSAEDEDTRQANLGPWVLPLLGLCLFLSTFALIRGRQKA